MKTFISVFGLAVAVVAVAAPAALACDDHEGPATAITASNVPKEAPAQKSAVVVGEQGVVAAPAKAVEPTFKLVSVDDVALGLAALQKDHKPFVVLDANGKETRQSQGFIPTALLLTSASEYDLALLPREKSTPLVFYCANDKCTASHTAAKRALQSGYSDVGVLGAGISGWVKAGKPVQKQPVG